MAAFLVETYCTPAELSAGRPRLELIAQATGDSTGAPLPARLVYAVYIPEEETCFCLFEAISTQAVQEVAGRMGLRLERLNEAVLAWPPAPHQQPAISPPPPKSTSHSANIHPRRRSTHK